ncbi:unnamed protein product [Nesidiocoris tenuis]|uniref:Uncharacterized protein n=1 Tax=Nesidiocoris tenuis TaxID=355587 RepID=A0A6H5GVR6_9HEMI|nr:unnamed protein product [Nesidiocoris tenuis]
MRIIAKFRMIQNCNNYNNKSRSNNNNNYNNKNGSSSCNNNIINNNNNNNNNNNSKNSSSSSSNNNKATATTAAATTTAKAAAAAATITTTAAATTTTTAAATTPTSATVTTTKTAASTTTATTAPASTAAAAAATTSTKITTTTATLATTTKITTTTATLATATTAPASTAAAATSKTTTTTTAAAITTRQQLGRNGRENDERMTKMMFPRERRQFSVPQVACYRFRWPPPTLLTRGCMPGIAPEEDPTTIKPYKKVPFSSPLPVLQGVRSLNYSHFQGIGQMRLLDGFRKARARLLFHAPVVLVKEEEKNLKLFQKLHLELTCPIRIRIGLSRCASIERGPSKDFYKYLSIDSKPTMFQGQIHVRPWTYRWDAKGRPPAARRAVIQMLIKLTKNPNGIAHVPSAIDYQSHQCLHDDHASLHNSRSTRTKRLGVTKWGPPYVSKLPTTLANTCLLSRNPVVPHILKDVRAKKNAGISKIKTKHHTAPGLDAKIKLQVADSGLEVSGLPVSRNSRVQDFRSSGLPLFRNSSLQNFKRSGLPVFNTFDLQDFWSSAIPVLGTFDLQDFWSSECLAFRISSLQNFQFSELPAFRTASLPVLPAFRTLRVQGFRSSRLLIFGTSSDRASRVQDFKSSALSVLRTFDLQDFRFLGLLVFRTSGL